MGSLRASQLPRQNRRVTDCSEGGARPTRITPPGHRVAFESRSDHNRSAMRLGASCQLCLSAFPPYSLVFLSVLLGPHRLLRLFLLRGVFPPIYI